MPIILPSGQNKTVREEDEYLSPPAMDNKPFGVCGLIITFTSMGKVYHNRADGFPCKSNRGNQYIFILSDSDGNEILARAIKNNQTATIRYAWQYLHNILNSKGDYPYLYIMYSESYSDMKEAMTKYEINYQMACSAKKCDKNGHLLGFVPHTCLFFWPFYEYLYLVYKYSSLLIIIL